MSDERISEGPPALPGGEIEALRWRDDDGNDLAIDANGRTWFWVIVENRWQWFKITDHTDETRRRLAAELAAYRERRDGGDGEAWRLLGELEERFRPTTCEEAGYEPGTAGYVCGDCCIRAETVEDIEHQDDCDWTRIAALLARRAATLAGGERTER